MSDKSTIQKVADALFGKKEPVNVPQVNGKPNPAAKLPDFEAERRKANIHTIGVRG